MIALQMKKGFRLRMDGEPSRQVETIRDVDRVAVLPETIPFIKPRLMVREGDRVKRGAVLFHDKRNPAIRFLSPGGGTVEAIHFGPRRVIQRIVIRLDAEEETVRFESVTEDRLSSMTREQLIEKLLERGVWPLLRELPFRDIARPDAHPPAIIISLETQDPFHPLPEVYLNGSGDLLAYGIRVLERIAPNVFVTACGEIEALRGRITHIIKGHYPAGDPGITLYHTRISTADNGAWYIHGQDLLWLAESLKTGAYPIRRTIAVSAGSIRRHVRTRMGAPLALLAGEAGGRFLEGGVFGGRHTERDAYLGFYATALTVLPAGDAAEMFGFLRPGYKKPSRWRAFLSALNPGTFAADTGLHGEARACVNCGGCAAVCPVNILPQFTMKALHAGEVEEALKHGLLDCVECGLCAYVCPSKIELAEIFRLAKKEYHDSMTHSE